MNTRLIFNVVFCCCCISFTVANNAIGHESANADQGLLVSDTNEKQMFAQRVRILHRRIRAALATSDTDATFMALDAELSKLASYGVDASSQLQPLFDLLHPQILKSPEGIRESISECNKLSLSYRSLQACVNALSRFRLQYRHASHLKEEVVGSIHRAIEITLKHSLKLVETFPLGLEVLASNYRVLQKLGNNAIISPSESFERTLKRIEQEFSTIVSSLLEAIEGAEAVEAPVYDKIAGLYIVLKTFDLHIIDGFDNLQTRLIFLKKIRPEVPRRRKHNINLLLNDQESSTRKRKRPEGSLRGMSTPKKKYPRETKD